VDCRTASPSQYEVTPKENLLLLVEHAGGGAHPYSVNRMDGACGITNSAAWFGPSQLGVWVSSRNSATQDRFPRTHPMFTSMKNEITNRHCRFQQVISLIICASCARYATSTELLSHIVDFDLPQQSLDAALLKFSNQAHVQLIFNTGESSRTEAPAIRGSRFADATLSELLERTGLWYRVIGKTIVVSPAGDPEYDAGLQPMGRLDIDEIAATPAGSVADGNVDSQPPAGAREYGVGGKAKPADGLQEVIVTAQKRNERQQDVPMSITAITANQLRERGATDIKDVLGSVPGLSYTSQERGQSSYSIRGVTNQSLTPTVGIFLDDIPLITNAGVNTGAVDPILFDMARVEVLKGPQGTLYGGSSMGGAIKYVSAIPDPSENSGYVTSGLRATEHGNISYNAEGVANLPIVSDVLAVRAGASYRHDGGYIDNIPNANLQNIAVSSTPSPVYTPLTEPSLSTLDDKDHNHAETYVGRASLLWMPDKTWSIKPSAYFQEYREANPSVFWPNLVGLVASFRQGQPTSDQVGIYSLDIKKAINDIEITSLSAYYTRKLSWKRDYSYFIGGFIPEIFPISNSLANYPINTNTFSEEVRVSSKAVEDLPLSWLIGLYYSNQKDQFDPLVTTQNAGFPNDLAFLSNQSHKTDQYAAFGEATYRIWRGLDLTAGARLFRIQQNTIEASDGPFNGGPSQVGGDSNEKGVSPKFNVSYKLAADHLVYASATRGFRPGGPELNILPPTCDADLAHLGFSGSPTSYRSDSIWSYEAGSKNEFGDHHIVNTALFYGNWKGIQQGVSLPCGFSFTANAGRATIKGMELEARFNLTQSFQLGANGSFTDAHLVEAAFGTAAHNGDQILATPKWIGSVNADYSIPLGAEWKLSSRAEFQYRSRQRLQYARTQQVVFSDNVVEDEPLPGEFQGGFGSANLSATLRNRSTSLRLSIDNLFDRRPILNYQGVGLGYTYAETLRPRTMGFSVTQDF